MQAMMSRLSALCICLILVQVSGRRSNTQGIAAKLQSIQEQAMAVKCYTPAEASEPKEQCGADKYYEGVDVTNAEALHEKIKGQRVLLYGTQNPDDPEFQCADVWKAADILDVNKDEPSKVDLIYSKNPAEKTSRKDGYWNREHVWPKSYGVSCKFKQKKWSKTRRGVKCKSKNTYVEDNGPFTDIHHLFPSRTSVNGDRSSQYFDACTPGTCNFEHHADDGYSAEDEDAGESWDNTTFWQPPRKSRGVVARALFYMALRYNGDEANTFDLTLTDHPSYCNDALGKLSVLKKWHEEFPPTEAEQQRNEKACWMQGNRNPFVDHPGLVEKLFGAGASPHLVTENPTACEGSSIRAKKCDPNAETINLCTEDTKPSE
jgi:endonuclease I